VLKGKGVITEEDYEEVTKVKPFYYKLGKGFTFTTNDEKFQLALGGRLQFRYAFTGYEINSSTILCYEPVRRQADQYDRPRR
jgi:phosphate-selective porin OprO/OprP